jgi:hypothetical protein
MLYNYLKIKGLTHSTPFAESLVRCPVALQTVKHPALNGFMDSGDVNLSFIFLVIDHVLQLGDSHELFFEF